MATGDGLPVGGLGSLHVTLLLEQHPKVGRRPGGYFGVLSCDSCEDLLSTKWKLTQVSTDASTNSFRRRDKSESLVPSRVKNRLGRPPILSISGSDEVV